ncbi:MAG: SRPBCC family protein [Candidatus Eisenbacteria bacterium]|uniref:SRPBCC family protein n=1 Tax=Eiseniibacteriota bacterium TaxID=2212470 RepID=A0A849SC47_UNCEI|nr:SRPBCC family protein [Candidatus Eisenbacteria bacterium]
MIKKVALTLFALIALTILAIFGIASMRPDTFRIERKIVMKAAPATIYLIANDFNHWTKWSPWEALDPDMKKNIEGPGVGVGAVYTWSGNDKVGEGKMSILESTPDSRVGMQLQFIKPFQATNNVEIQIAPVEGGSEVTWAMSGTNNMMAKVMSLFMNMDQTVGKDFETGLANLKVLAESQPPPPPPGNPAESMGAGGKIVTD